MLFSLGVMNDWAIALIGLKLAFMQAQLPEPVCLELPPGCQKANPHLAGMVMKIAASLCGDQRAANLWHNKIWASLKNNLKIKCSEFDPCLFICHDCILCLHIDDAILPAKDESVLADGLKVIDSASCAFSQDDSVLCCILVFWWNNSLMV